MMEERVSGMLEMVTNTYWKLQLTIHKGQISVGEAITHCMSLTECVAPPKRLRYALDKLGIELIEGHQAAYVEAMMAGKIKPKWNNVTELKSYAQQKHAKEVLLRIFHKGRSGSQTAAKAPKLS